jgi:hypothetical protein
MAKRQRLLANCGEGRESRRVNPGSSCAVATTTVLTLSTERIYAAVAQIVEEPDAPLSAWPDRFPGRWATAALVAQITGEKPSASSTRLRELVDHGAVRVESVWPSTPRGYQLTPQAEMAEPPGAPLSSPPDPRRVVIDALIRWAASHGGLAPTKRDWSHERDPDRRWPRSKSVSQRFVSEAEEASVRWFERRDGQRHGPSGWQYALQLAGLEVRTGADSQARAAQTLGCNRQMVTAGAADIHPQYFES